MIHRRTAIFSALMLFMFFSSVAQDNKLKASYIFSFAQYVEWPKEYSKGAFVVGIIGNSNLEDNLRGFLAGRTINNQYAVVKKFSEIDDLSRCHILVVVGEASSFSGKIMEKLKPYHTLVIAEREGMFRNGSGISFVEKSSRLSFDLNRKNIMNKGLRIDNQFEILAANVH